MRTRTILTALLALATGLSQAQVRGDDVLQDMGNAFRKGDRARLTQLLPQARGHVLEPWAAYWELRARLDTASPQEVQDFFTRYAGTYQEDRLRNDWLLLLGQRRDWTTFEDEHAKFRMRDDNQVRCYALAVQFLREGGNAPAGLADEVRRLWFGARGADDACTFAASRLIGEGSGRHRLTQADAWRKARIAMEANQSRAVAAAVELAAPQALHLLAEVQASPVRFLTAKATANGVRRELIGLALIKLATSDADQAQRLLESKWGPALPAEERDWLWGQLGKQAAQKLDSDALSLYAKVGRLSHLSDDMLAWKARAALRAGSTPDWPRVLAAIDAMTDEYRARDTAWTYWKAKALMAGRSESHQAEGRALLASIASVRGFYEMLATEELGRPLVVPPRPSPLTADEMAGARANPTLQRALYAIGIGLRQDGVREWNWGTNLARPGGLPERELLAAAQLACEREVWDRCINTSERSREAFDAEQRFPMPFRDAVVRRAREINLDPAYVYGLIRQESRFIMDARSGVGASGLMQVMPATARWTARKIGLTGFTPDQITDRDTNIAIGTGYLKLVLDDFDGSMPLAAAAYNAGPSRPRNWRNGPVIDAAAWAENVPFSETRDYVKKVLANTTLYAAILTGQPQSLRARLGKVGPRDAAQPEPNKDLP